MNKIIYLCITILITSCAAVDLLTPSDPCADQFESVLHVNKCRVELGIQAEAGKIIAEANAATSGDTVAQAKLQKRLDRLKQLKHQQRQAVSLLVNDPRSAEAQLSVLIAALESIKNEQ